MFVSANIINVCYSYVSDHKTQELLCLLTPEELIHSKKLRSAKDQSVYILSRIMTRAILSKQVGSKPKALIFGSSEHKKPFLKDHPAVHFNLSHSEDIIVLAVSAIGPVGIDVESLERNVRFEALKSRIFNDAELLVFDGLPLEKKQEAFINAWTRKEAFLKALGVGLRESPKKIKVTFEPEMEAKITSLPEGTQEASWSIKSLDFTGNYRGAVIVKGAAIQTRLVLVNEFEG